MGRLNGRHNPTQAGAKFDVVREFRCPYGARWIEVVAPASELAGYYQMSLRDKRRLQTVPLQRLGLECGGRGLDIRD